MFVDLGGKKHVTPMGGNKYPMIIRDDFSRYAWLYFISHKSDAAEAFKQFWADLRVEGIPSEVVVVRSILVVNSTKGNSDSFIGKEI